MEPDNFLACKYKAEIKNSWENFKTRFEQVEESANLKERSFEIMQAKEEKEQKTKNRRTEPKRDVGQ